jgi:hypothetical protein
MRHNPWNLTTLRVLTVLTGAITSAWSLTQIAFEVDGSDRSVERLPAYGWELLISGWLGVFDANPLMLFIWLANPIIVVTWILYLRGRWSAAWTFSLFALGVTLSFLLVGSVLGPGPEGVNVADFEMREIISYGMGYWPWVASAAVLVVGVRIGNAASRIVGK